MGVELRSNRVSDRIPNRPRVARDLLLRALLAMLPHASSRDVAFSDEAREDAVMDAILRVLEHEEHDPEAVEVADRVARRYASRVVHNLLVDRFRAARRFPTEPLEDTSDRATETDVDSVVENDRMLAPRLRATALLGELSAAEQGLLSAYFTDSDAFREEFRRLGIAEGTARVRVHRLIRRLRNRAAENGRTRFPRP